MSLIDFSGSNRQAFLRGFVKGMGAPFVLYGTFSAPRLPAIDLVVPKAAGYPSDWQKVGNDLRAAIGEYGKTAAASK